MATLLPASNSMKGSAIVDRTAGQVPGKSPGKSSGKSILCIDDDPDILNFLKVILEDQGFTFAGAESYTDCKTLLGSGLQPAIILLDIEMPEMDGFETLAALKQTLGNKLAPVIFLTAKTDVDFISRSKKSGAGGYIIKPVQPERLLERIGEFLALSKPILPYD